MLGMITGSEEVEKRGERIRAVPLGGAALQGTGENFSLQIQRPATLGPLVPSLVKRKCSPVIRGCRLMGV